jgi:hypothetical protein
MKKKSEAKKQGAVHSREKCECMPREEIGRLEKMMKEQGINGRLRLCNQVCVKMGGYSTTLAYGKCKVPVEGEHPQPRDDVLAWIEENYAAASGSRDFGEDRRDQYWAHSFTNLSMPGYLCEIQGAVLEIVVKNKHGNDHLKFGCIDSPTDDWEFSWKLTQIGVQVGEQKKLTYDLSNANGMNLLDTIMSHGFLDVAVDDDSIVYCVKLSLKCRCIPIDYASRASASKGGFAVGGFSGA